MVRVPEGETQSAEGVVRSRIRRMEASLSRSERMLLTAQDREQKGDVGGARILKRRAREEARMAMRLIGILLIEYGLDMSGPIMRARRIVVATRNGHVGNGQPNSL